MSLERERDPYHGVSTDLQAKKGIFLSKLIEVASLGNTLEEQLGSLSELLRRSISAASLTLRLEGKGESFSSVSRPDPNVLFSDLSSTPVDGIALQDTPREPFHVPVVWQTETPPQKEELSFAVGNMVAHLEWISAHEDRDGKSRRFLEFLQKEISGILAGKLRERQRTDLAIERVRYLQRMFRSLCHDAGNTVFVIQNDSVLSDLSGQACDELQELTRVYLQLSRSEGIGIKILDLHELVGDVIDEFREQTSFREKSIATDIRFDPDCEAVANDVLIKTAFRNLLKNAVEFSPERGTITIRGRRELVTQEHPMHLSFLDKPVVHVTIEDQGPGILPQLRRDIFAKEASTHRGEHGIGLRSVYDVVKLHHGQVQLETKNGEGSFTRFEIFLPAPERGIVKAN